MVSRHTQIHSRDTVLGCAFRSLLRAHVLSNVCTHWHTSWAKKGKSKEAYKQYKEQVGIKVGTMPLPVCHVYTHAYTLNMHTLIHRDPRPLVHNYTYRSRAALTCC